MTNESIPEDFPREGPTASLSGVHPKLSVRHDAITDAYVTGLTFAELRDRYEICADLVDQLVAKCQKNRGTKYASMTETKILAGLFEQLTKTNWGSREEMAWIVRHTASELEWPALDAAEKLLIPEQRQRIPDA